MYTNAPYYDSHLCKVADLVTSVTDNATMFAAACLQDVVENTPATLDDVRALIEDRVAVLRR